MSNNLIRLNKENKEYVLLIGWILTSILVFSVSVFYYSILQLSFIQIFIHGIILGFCLGMVVMQINNLNDRKIETLKDDKNEKII